MKANSLKILIPIYILCTNIVTASVFAVNKDKELNQPKLIFEDISYDYGTVNPKDDGEAIFIFKNEGTAPLIVTDVNASCGCTTIRWSQDPIMPGKIGEVVLNYNTNIVGEIKKSISVISNDPNKARTILFLTGKVEKNKE